jgi:mRNA interferase MazF
MKRGEVWTVSGTGYAGKPRPAVILQADSFPHLESVTVCPFTTDPADLELFRISVSPEDTNGLVRPSHVMADKITTVPRNKLGRRLGVLDAEVMRRIETAVLVFLGLT